MMIKKTGLFFLCLFCCVGIAFAEKEDKPDKTLSKLQKQQIKVFVELQKSMLNAPNKTNDLLKKSFELIAENSVDSYSEYAAYGQKLEDRVESLLTEGKTKSAEKYSMAASYYLKIAKENKKMIRFFKNYDRNKFETALNSYLEIESTIKKNNLKIIKREWLSPKEVSEVVLQYMKAKKGNRKDNDKKEEK
ncbi:MAG: hypothetical protein WCS73_09940 [Lentisphaeria bacterium]